MMTKITCMLAIFAAASTAAVAKDLKQDKKATAPTAATAQMPGGVPEDATAGPTMRQIG